jgi:hypothetical protein
MKAPSNGTLGQFLDGARPFRGENRFVLGTFERGVTFYRQQVRALNLIFAFVEAKSSDETKIIEPGSRIAIIGGGALGLTAATAAVYAGFRVTIFEQQQFLIHLQRGCATRWLHPRFYDWPAVESESRMARLPMLDWAASTAAVVAAELEREVGALALKRPKDLKVFLETSGLEVARQGTIFEVRCHTARSQEIVPCDAVIYAVGLGTERGVNTASYWRNDQLDQTELEFTNGKKVKYVISGIGDGGLVDLFRLTIRNFRHESIFHELFGVPNGRFVRRLRLIQRQVADSEGWLFDQFERLNERERGMTNALTELRGRLRSDTEVVLNGKAESLRVGLNLNRISFGNALLAYCLFRVDAFDYKTGELDTIRRRLLRVPDAAARPSWLANATTIIVRHGTDREKALREISLGDQEIEIVRAQRNTGNPMYPDGWWGQYTRPTDSKRDGQSFTPIEFVPPALVSHATTFVSTLANVLGVLIDRSKKREKGKRKFRLTLHRLTRFDGHQVFQQITPYSGRVESSSGLGRYFRVEGGIVGLSCRTGSLVVVEKKDEKKFDQVWEMTDLQASGAKSIRPYVDSLLACPFFAPEKRGGKQHVAMVLFVDAAEAGFFNAEVQETISAACSGFVRLLEGLHASGALRPVVSFYPGFRVQKGVKQNNEIAKLKRLGVKFTDANDRGWKKGLTFSSLHSLDLEVGPSMKMS